MSTPFLWHNGRIKPWADATVHVTTHALHYGSSVFEGERVYATPQGPAYFRLADHTRRLFESARVYDIDIGFSEAEINTACLEVIRANRRIPHARAAMHKVRAMAQPVTLDEMMAITGVWVDTALQLGEKSMRTMERLVRAQYRRHGAPAAQA